MNTLLLTTIPSSASPSAWDLTKDASGNIAMATGGYAMAQDAASACRLFAGELWYDTIKGVPYWTEVLGLAVGLNVLKALLIMAALTVPGVLRARVFILSYKNRKIGGQVQVTDQTGFVFAAGF